MTADRIDRIIANYESGAFTDGTACLEVLIAAGEGDAQAVFARLTPELRELVSRHVAGVKPGEQRIIESWCGSASAEDYAADLRRREDMMRRGIVELQHLASGRTSAG